MASTFFANSVISPLIVCIISPVSYRKSYICNFYFQKSPIILNKFLTHFLCSFYIGPIFHHKICRNHMQDPQHVVLYVYQRRLQIKIPPPERLLRGRQGQCLMVFWGLPPLWTTVLTMATTRFFKLFRLSCPFDLCRRPWCRFDRPCRRSRRRRWRS